MNSQPFDMYIKPCVGACGNLYMEGRHVLPQHNCLQTSKLTYNDLPEALCVQQLPHQMT